MGWGLPARKVHLLPPAKMCFATHISLTIFPGTCMPWVYYAAAYSGVPARASPGHRESRGRRGLRRSVSLLGNFSEGGPAYNLEPRVQILDPQYPVRFLIGFNIWRQIGRGLSSNQWLSPWMSLRCHGGVGRSWRCTRRPSSTWRPSRGSTVRSTSCSRATIGPFHLWPISELVLLLQTFQNRFEWKMKSGDVGTFSWMKSKWPIVFISGH